jgi:HlyD family secretion protein
MNADASILVTNLDNVLLVPIEAVTTAGSRSFVYVRGSSEAAGTAAASTAATRPEGASPGERPDRVRPVNGAAAGDSASRQSRGAGALSGTADTENALSDYYAGASRIQVEVGAHNETHMEIVKGLAEGDQVVLPPLTTSTASTSTQTTQAGGLGGLMGGGMPAGGIPAGRPETGGGGFRPD